MAAALPVAYLNGEFLPVAEARISPLDRGFLFADAVYEVIPVYGGSPMLLDAHLQRLARSLKELCIRDPMSDHQWRELVRELVQRNGGGDMGLYLQVSRGADNGRDHRMPTELTATVFGMASPITATSGDPGIAAVTAPDERWARCDIKATGLMANLLARQSAEAAGASEALLIKHGMVTEGASSSVIIAETGGLIRRPNSHEILPGTTTDLVIRVAAEAGISCREETISEARLRNADEIWIASALRGVVPVVKLDGRPVGSGQPGPLWQTVAPLYEARKHGQ